MNEVTVAAQVALDSEGREQGRSLRGLQPVDAKGLRRIRIALDQRRRQSVDRGRTRPRVERKIFFTSLPLPFGVGFIRCIPSAFPPPPGRPAQRPRRKDGTVSSSLNRWQEFR